MSNGLRNNKAFFAWIHGESGEFTRNGQALTYCGHPVAKVHAVSALRTDWTCPQCRSLDAAKEQVRRETVHGAKTFIEKDYKDKRLLLRKPSPVEPLRPQLEKLQVNVSRDAMTWIRKKAAENRLSQGAIIEDLVTAAQRGEQPIFCAKTPGYVARARQAETKRRARVEALQHREAIRKQDDGELDDGSATDF